MLSGKIERGSDCVMFAYCSACHPLPNFFRDLFQVRAVNGTLSRSVKLVQLFRNMHVANRLLKVARNNLPNQPPTIN